MKKYIFYFFLFFILVLFSLCVYLYHALQKSNATSSSFESQAKNNNQQAIIWKDKYNKSHLRKEVSEIKDEKILQYDLAIKEILSNFEELKKNNKNLNFLSHTVTENRTNINTFLKDSIIKDTQHVQCIHFNNGYTSLDGCFGVGDGPLLINRDSISQVGYKLRKTKKGKKIFWPFGKLILETELKSSNPNTNLIYNKTIQIKKK